MTAAALMVQGTTSGAGKSLVVTALCRALWRRGVLVAPFKPQNMALNSAVTAAGGEIGRAQAVQAAACGLAPHTDMNPILLKPNSEVGAQVIVAGRSVGNMDARKYHAFKPTALRYALESYHRLADRFEVVVIEGAGSPAEVNLRAGDLANMGFAEAVDCPVLLVGDIDRGGVFAQFVGTLSLLSPSERQRIRGFLVNRFRGDRALLQPGLTWLSRRTRRPVVGVLPYLPDLYLAAEDSFFDTSRREGGSGRFRVVVPRLPRLSNHTDLDPLRLHPGVDLRWIEAGDELAPADLVILPGSKSVRADLAWFGRQGWDEALRRHLRYGGKVIGLCGGYQMLGRTLRDPGGWEGPAGESPGLGLLEVTTTLQADKILRQVTGRWYPGGAEVAGYEMHMGRTEGPDLVRPALLLGEEPHGAVSADGQVLGVYLHGLFDRPSGCSALLAWAGMATGTVPVDPDRLAEAAFDRLATAFTEAVDWTRLLGWMGLGGPLTA